MSKFTDHLVEVFEAFGPVRTRPMFGGHGLYHHDLMFGLVADDLLYLKADTQIQDRFTERGLTPFIYVKNGKAMQMSYYAAPEEIFDDKAAAREWATLAFDAALRGRSKSSKRKR